MVDYLTPLPASRVAAWYRRLADRFSRERIDNQEPLAAVFLRQWLNNRDSNFTLTFNAPNYLKQSGYVVDVLKHQRKVFLTQEQARRGNLPPVWGGVIPRLQALPGFTPWSPPDPLSMTYECLVEVGSNAIDIARIQLRGTPQEKDLFYSLRGFQLKSEVRVNGALLPTPIPSIQITFTSWSSRVIDKFDFNYNEYITVGNPDYQSTLADAIRPQDETIVVYHSNARRLEQANLACPYRIQSNSWTVSDANITGPANVDPNQQL
jgi:hypothetical protein